jgi:hypothetical protein
MKQTWPTSGHEVVYMLKKALKSSTLYCSCGLFFPASLYRQLLKKTDEFTDGTIVAVNLNDSNASMVAQGGPAALSELCEGLAWLGSALRLSPPHGIYSAAPKVEIAIDQKSTYREPSLEVVIDFTVTPLLKSSHLSRIKDGICWHALFHTPLVAQGFPIRARSEYEHGLEIPLDMMVLLSETSFATQYDGTLILKGFSTMFVPTRSMQQSVVWHFLTNQGARITHFAFRQRCVNYVGIEDLDVHRLRKGNFRNFVGWAPNVTRHLGRSIPSRSFSISFTI